MIKFNRGLQKSGKNRLKLRFISCAATIALVFCLMPIMTFAQTGDSGVDNFVPGLIREDVSMEYPPLRPPGRSATAPSYTSLHVSAVENQGPNGLCWAFTANAVIESNMLINNQGLQNFSELHMGYATSTANGNSQQGFSTRPAPDYGGNRMIAAAYLMRGAKPLNLSGTVNESADSYAPYINSSIPSGRALTTTGGMPRTYDVQNIMFLTGDKDDLERARIKQAVVDYGAVGASMYWDDSGVPVAGASSIYHNPTTHAYYLPSHKTWAGGDDSNHAVLIIGWDDNYARTNFVSGSQPSNDGAWLVKNSWGTGWGYDGLFWISYDDTNFPLDTWVVDGVKPHNTNTAVYEYDYLGMNGASGYSGTTNYFVRIFDVNNSNEQLNQVRLGVLSPNLTVDVDVIPNFTNFTGYSASTFAVKGSKSLQYPGHYTIDLTNPVTLGNVGSRFAVVVKVTGSAQTWVGYNSVPATAGTAYLYNPNGAGSWETQTANGNYNIKAVTTPLSSDTPSPVEIISHPPAARNVSEGGNAVFSVTASGTPAPTFQWQVSTDGGNTWTDIIGATSSTLTVTGVGAAHNGNMYRCAVTNTLGVVYSNVSTLTVTENFGPVPATSIPDVSGAATAMFMFLVLSGTLWGYIIIRKCKR